MVHELFDIFVYKRKDGKIDDVVCEGVWRVDSEIGMKKFLDEMFNYLSDGYVVEVEKI